MNRVNYTTRYSQINSIKNEINVLNQKLNALSHRLQLYIQSNPNTKTRQSNFSELSEDIQTTISTLSKNVDVMLNQMLEAQRQLTEANTIVIKRVILPSNIHITSDKNKLLFEFERLPTNLDGYLELTTDELQYPLLIYYDAIHHSTHTSNPEYKSTIVTSNKLSLKMKTIFHNPKIIKSTFITSYEFEQDALISHCVNQLDNTYPNFFENILNNIEEIKN